MVVYSMVMLIMHISAYRNMLAYGESVHYPSCFGFGLPSMDPVQSRLRVCEVRGARCSLPCIRWQSVAGEVEPAIEMVYTFDCAILGGHYAFPIRMDQIDQTVGELKSKIKEENHLHGTASMPPPSIHTKLTSLCPTTHIRR